MLLDASEPISEQDLRVLTMVVESGRACVLALNKWDLVDEDRRHQLERSWTAASSGCRGRSASTSPR